MRQPAGGQQLLPEFWIELDGGMEASTPRADVDGAVGIASEDWREASWRLAQRYGQRVVMLGRGGERGVFLGIAIVDGVPGHAEVAGRI